MNRNIVFLVCFVSLLTGLSAMDGDHHFSMGFSGGVLNGRSEFIVFRDANSDDYLSELLWGMNPLIYWGTDLR